MRSLCLTIARITLPAWIGAAVLFVCTSVSEQISTAYDSDVKNTLAVIRFPWFYGFGFGLLATGLVCGAIGIDRTQHRGRWNLFVFTLVATLLLMSIDYATIYSPLFEIVSRPDGVRDARFQQLHRWSEQINTADLLVCLIAVVTICRPQCGSTAK